MRRSSLVVLGLVMVLVLALAASAADFPLPISGLGVKTTTTVKAKKPYLLACVVKNSTNPYMIKQLEGFKAAAKAMGFQALAMAPAKQDNIEEQVKIIEDLLQRGVQGIAIHPSDSNGIVPVVEKAVAMGVPVVAIGTPANTDKVMLRTGMDYYRSGYVITEAVAKRLGGRGNVIILEGPPQAINAKERLDGIKAALAKYPNIKILASQPANFRRLDALQVMENLLQRFPKVDGVIACNDEMALGAVQALEAAGRLKGTIVSGVDGSKDATAAIKEGRLTITSNADPWSSAWCAAAYLVLYLNDGTLPPSKFIPYPPIEESMLVTKDNIDQYIAEDAWWK
ncbi:MAG: sugar ABC transporter substrate-binding protein [Bacillota bacterium]|nr:sugar ABC transporter substrate-binding protein [Bacillota bacterium]